ncbi:MAG: S9 family peptidase [Candidatus Aminicenantes bacterium]|nr:MAG: S9 family peptidase [Candidatus Aminicenantes bacterium]
MKKSLIIIAGLFIFFMRGQSTAVEDPFLWLEEVKGKKALEWVEQQNKKTAAELESIPGFKECNEKALEILNSDKRIPYAVQKGNYLYNFWRDTQHLRGVYRRTTLAEYRKENPRWEIILDIDALAKEEGENWVFIEMNFLYPDYNRSLLSLSRGGGDAIVVREFDIPNKSFVKNGFQLPEAKSTAAWLDMNTIFVASDFGQDTLTTSGYPRMVKLWKRGTPLNKAKTIFETKKTSVYAYGSRLFSDEGHIDLVTDAKTFFKHDKYLLADGKLKKIDIPEDADIIGYFKKQLLIRLRGDWKIDNKIYKQDSVIIGKLEDVMAGKKEFHLLMAPGERCSISSVNTTKNMILITVLDNVVSKLYQFTWQDTGKWQRKQIKIADNGTLSVFSTNEKSDDYFIIYENFLTPSSLYMVSGSTGKIEKLKSLPDFFEARPFKTRQLEATSRDGTKIAYFMVMRNDIKFNGKNPTILYGYGGFQVSFTPNYSASLGCCWLEKGGVYVLANIRGGGEFGPKWHQAALKKNRHKAYEDFIAVAQDLIKRKITSPDKLSIMGGSNGGLLVGVVFTMRPDLFKAVVCWGPLLDMKRYTRLPPGASWIAEYGDPDDPDMWEYIKTYSPYHNLKKNVKYPKVLFTTSTHDDRVHPGHARKMAAKMQDMGYKVYFYEHTQGGHNSAVNNQQIAYGIALDYGFLYKLLMSK